MTNPETLEQDKLRFPTIDAGVRIGHVHLKVADLQRALDFYCGVLGFELTTSRPGAAFISAGGYHRRRPAPPGSITRRSSTRPGGCSPTRCAD